MNRADIRAEIEKDLRRSPTQTVIYLEGKSDVEYLFALLGRATPPGDADRKIFHEGILVKGCDKGSGSKAVKDRVTVANGFRNQGFVFGIVDGDGLTPPELAANFDPPYSGPLFIWKAYCIENLLAKTGWPSAWGDEPDWRAELAAYGPYVALNRVGVEVRNALDQMKLGKYLNPDGPLKAASDFVGSLASGKASLMSFDVERRFVEELVAFEDTVQRSLDEAHTYLQGKWLVDHLAPRLSRRNNALICKSEWVAHAISVGGLSEVRDWWKRVRSLAIIDS